MKLNNHILAFSGLFLGISAILLVVLQKYLPLFLHHTVTFCQEMAKTISFGLPNNLGIVIASILFIVILITLTKLLMIVINMWFRRRDLYKNIVYKNSNYIVVNSSTPFAFCFGIISPRIYVSNKLIQILSKEEFRTVIAHENYHLKSHDTITLSLASVFESLFPYFPIISDVIKHYKIERELMADQFAIIESGGNRNLISVLKKLLKYKPQFSFAGIPAIAEIDTLEPRINKLINNQHFVKKFKLRNLIISFMSFIILATLAIIPVNTAEVHSKGEDTVILCVDNKMSTYYTS